MTPGEQVLLFNGTGGEYFGEIVAINKRSVEVQLTYFNEARPQLTLAGAISWSGDRQRRSHGLRHPEKPWNWGVSEITPLFSRRCEVRAVGRAPR